VSGQLHTPYAILPGVRAPGTRWIAGWVGPRAGPDAVKKRKIPCLHREFYAAHPARSVVTILTELPQLHAKSW
jgi:hypothetical protein